MTLAGTCRATGAGGGSQRMALQDSKYQFNCVAPFVCRKYEFTPTFRVRHRPLHRWPVFCHLGTGLGVCPMATAMPCCQTCLQRWRHWGTPGFGWRCATPTTPPTRRTGRTGRCMRWCWPVWWQTTTAGEWSPGSSLQSTWVFPPPCRWM
jgi:hypothetical protein